MEKRKVAKLIGIFIVAVLLIILIVQNSHSVNLELWFWTVSGPLVILLLITGVLGGILGFLVARTRLNKRANGRAGR